MALQSTAVDAPPDIAGIVSTRRPEPSPDVAWAAVPDYSNQPQSTAFSEDVRVLLSGTGAATAVITIVDVSGDTAATLGLSISGGDNLASAAATVGSGVFRLKATYNSVEYLSASFTFSVVTVASDTLAPTEVLPLSWVANGATQVDLSFLVPIDPKAPSVDATGVKEIEIHRSTDGTNFSLLATKPVSPGISPQLVQNTVGTVGGTPVVTQNGADWEITAQSGGNAGRGFILTADGLVFVAAPVSGDFTATVLVKEFGGILGSFSAAYLMARETLAADSKAIAATSRADNDIDTNTDGFGDNVRCQSQHRLTTGGNQGSEVAVQNVLGDRYLRLDRAGNTFTTYFWQASLTAWQQMGQQTIATVDSIFVGLAVAPRSGDSSTITVAFEEFAVTTQAVVTHSDTGLTEGQTYYYKARGTDLAS